MTGGNPKRICSFWELSIKQKNKVRAALRDSTPDYTEKFYVVNFDGEIFAVELTCIEDALPEEVHSATC